VKNVLGLLNNVINNCLEEFDSKGKIVGLGLAVPGPFNIKKGEISYLTNIKGWSNVPIKSYFQDKYKFPVVLIEAANATAVAEKWFGCAKKYDNFISILVSKGIGAGIYIDGKVYTGKSGFAGEIGQVSLDYNGPLCDCYNKGCLEYYCSTISFFKKINKLIKQKDSINTFEELLASKKIDKLTINNLVKDNGRYLGYAIVNLINLFDVELIVINSEIVIFGEIWMQSIKSAIIDRVSPVMLEGVDIKYSELNDDPILLGAIATVFNNIFTNPRIDFFENKAINASNLNV
jgi:predicted NBD/HSP70 family sugar kinase